jgi:Protein of unknown function (DUF4232)
MTSYGHVGWRVAAVVAFAGTAALAVTLTRAPVGSQAALSSNVTCPTSGLQAWLALGTGGGSGTGTGGTGALVAGGTYYTLEFTNVSHRACSLYGYPEVSAYADSQMTGGQSMGGSVAIRDTAVRPRPVTLQPGATAHSVLRVAGTGSSQPPACAQVIAQEIRVSPPDGGRYLGRPAAFPVHIPVCSERGQVSLTVQAIQARPGIPGP